jgi:hypothetical protein
MKLTENILVAWIGGKDMPMDKRPSKNDNPA